MQPQEGERKGQSAPNRTGWMRVHAEAKHLLTIMDGTTKASASQRSDAHQQYYSVWDAAVIQTTDESRSEDLLPMLPQQPDQAQSIALDSEAMTFQLSRQMREELYCPFAHGDSKVAIARRQAWCASATPVLLALYRLKYANDADGAPQQLLTQSVCSVILGLTEGGWAGWVPESILLWLLVTAEQALLSEAVSSVVWTLVWSKLLPGWFTNRWVSPDYPSIRAFHQRVTHV